jgi:pyruvate-ferredoxin/flavodoxin oxidoreductase
MLMLPNMYKIAGELTYTYNISYCGAITRSPSFIIFGHHTDVMAARSTAFAMLCAASVHEAQDFTLISTRATLESRIPFLHFFDGVRTSHKVDKVETLTTEDLQKLIPIELVIADCSRALTPDRPVLRGKSQKPDVYFQTR